MTETTSVDREAAFDETPGADRKAWTGTFGGVAGAVAMTSCCILPLVLISLGIGGVWIAQLTALYAYKWYMFAVAGATMQYGYPGRVVDQASGS